MMRSVPGQSVLSAVVGMKKQEHVKANLEIVKKAPMTNTEFFEGIKPIKRTEFIEDIVDM